LMFSFVHAEVGIGAGVSATRAINTSLATLPVGYFGGIKVNRPDDNIEMLLK